MKTLKLLVAIVLFLGSSQIGLAQSNSVPKFNSDSEKQAWIQANPDAYEAMLPAKSVVEKKAVATNSDVKTVVGVQKTNVQNTERFASEEDKKAWIQSNPAEHEAMQPATQAKKQDANVRSEERFTSEAEKTAWIKDNRQQYINEAKATSTVTPTNRKPAAPARKRAVN